MNELFQYKWNKFLLNEKESKGGLVPLDVVDFLIKTYAIKDAGKVNMRRGYFDFNDFGREYEEEFKDTAAAYIVPLKAMLINVNVAAGKFYTMINAIIHEIFHYNQDVKWQKGGENYRKSYVGNYKLPKGFNKNNLVKLNFFTLISFWREHYGYENAPHEIEAANWADSHTEEAIRKVLDREKKLNQSVRTAI